MLRGVVALVVLGSFVIGTPGPLWAQPDSAQQAPAGIVTAPLAPGGAAGIKQAQAQRGRIWNFAPFGVLGALAAVVVLMNDDDDNFATTTTGSN